MVPINYDDDLYCFCFRSVVFSLSPFAEKIGLLQIIKAKCRRDGKRANVERGASSARSSINYHSGWDETERRFSDINHVDADMLLHDTPLVFDLVAASRIVIRTRKRTEHNKKRMKRSGKRNENSPMSITRIQKEKYREGRTRRKVETTAK